MSRLVIVSNRLPVSIIRRSGEMRFQASVGGLATGLSAFCQHRNVVWIGWPGISSDKLQKQQQIEIKRRLAEDQCYPVFLSSSAIKNYYEGFSNQTIWPLFHYFLLRTVFEERYWHAYEKANQAFAQVVNQRVKPGDSLWIHDYQLMLLPQLIRKQFPDMLIGFFLHIPFPSFEMFRMLPWREEILHGLLGADLVGFHTFDYMRHFISSACRILGAEHSMGSLNIDKRIVKVDTFPMGIDYQRYAHAVNTPKVQKRLKTIRNTVGPRKIILSIDRLDYTKGIIERIEAFDLFLARNPAYKEKVTLILVAVPSRSQVQDYAQLRNHLERLVGRINGEHGTLGWVPIWYLYKFQPFEQLIALYHAADVALVTPLRDGMNLIAKEYLATKINGRGVLVLSEMAGAASELGEAIVVNTHNKAALIEAIQQALDMPEIEQIERNLRMQERLQRYTVTRWADDFMERLGDVQKTQQHLAVRKVSDQEKEMLIDDYHAAEQRLLLLDYDGTLVDFISRPDKAKPDTQLLDLMAQLASDTSNKIVIISGRDKDTLDQWYTGYNISLVAEHGAWLKKDNRSWQPTEPLHDDWKQIIRPILELFTDRTPGSLVEEKDFSLVWHFRQSDSELAGMRIQELKDAILNLTANENLGIYEGNKILEIRHAAINKGKAAELFLTSESWAFILAAGDDYTDEDMFAVLPENAYSIKIRPGVSQAKYYVDSPKQLRELLDELSRK